MRGRPGLTYAQTPSLQFADRSISTVIINRRELAISAAAGFDLVRRCAHCYRLTCPAGVMRRRTAAVINLLLIKLPRRRRRRPSADTGDLRSADHESAAAAGQIGDGRCIGALTNAVPSTTAHPVDRQHCISVTASPPSPTIDRLSFHNLTAISSLSGAMRSIAMSVSVCPYVCSLVYLKNRTSNIT